MKLIEIFKSPQFIVGSIISLTAIKLYFSGGTANNRHDMKERVVIVTGSSDGIGKETAKQLLEDGAIVIYANRDKNKTMNIINQLPEKEKKHAHFIKLDLSSFKSVINFVDNFKKEFGTLDILVNNAGSINYTYQLTEDNIEKTIQINTLSPILLTDKLIPLLKQSNGRIINVASSNHTYWTKDAKYYKELDLNNFDFNKKDYSALTQYNFSKIGNVYYTNHLAGKLNSFGIKTASLHPGVINTNIANFVPFFHYIKFIIYPFTWLFFKTPRQGAQTTLYLCYLKDEEFKNGGYYSDCKLSSSSKTGLNVESRDAYLKVSKDLIIKYGNENDISLDYI